MLKAGLRRRPQRLLLVAVDAFAAFVAFLRLDGERGDRARFQAFEGNRLARFLAVAVGPVFDALQRRIDLGDELALAVAGAQFYGAVGLRGRTVGQIGMILVIVLKMLQRLLGFLEDVFAPSQQLEPEILALAFAHERFPVRRPVVFFQWPRSFAVLVRSLVGSTVSTLHRLHVPPLRARDSARPRPAARLLYSGSMTVTTTMMAANAGLTTK